MTRLVPVALVLSVAGCAGTPTGALIDIPEVRVTPTVVARGEQIHLEVHNTTASEVILPPPVCATRLEQLSHGQWFAVPFPNPTCAGIEVSIAIGASHRFGIAAPATQPGRYRAVLHGTNADGTFVIRSPTFSVE